MHVSNISEHLSSLSHRAARRKIVLRKLSHRDLFRATLSREIINGNLFGQ